MNSRRPGKRKTERSLARSFVVTVAVGIPGALLASAGCSSSKPDLNATPGSTVGPQGPGVKTGACSDEGAQGPCHFSLGMTNKDTILSCFSGTQTCTGGRWSACGGEGLVTSSVVAAGLTSAPTSAPTGGIHTLAGVVANCGDGTCTAKKCMGGGDNNRSCTTSADCAGAKPCIAAETCTNCPGDCGVCPPGAPAAGVVICTADPCNPDCQGWTNAPGISSGAGVGVSVIGVSGFGQINNGMIQKLLLDKTNTGTDCDNYVAPGLPSSFYNCQVDTYCSMRQLGGDGDCHQFPSLAIQGTDPLSMGTIAAVPGVDLTIGPGCSDVEADKYRYFPVCNRGSVAVPPGTPITVRYTNPVQAFNPCPIGPAYDCSMKTNAVLGLPPGVCQLLDTQCPNCGPGATPCSQPNGDKWLFINATGSVAEGTMTMKPGAGPVGVTLPPDSEPTVGAGILGCGNNWTDHSPNNNPPSCGVQGQNVVTVSSDYHATCPAASHAVWNKLIYDTSTPKNGSGTSEVFFEAATAPEAIPGPGPGVFSPFYEMAESQNNNAGLPYVIAGATLGRDPEKCTFTLPAVPPYTWNTCTNAGPGPAPPCCPKDIESQLQRSVAALPFAGADPGPGAILARNAWLRLKITVKASPDNQKDATLNSWSISYQCVPDE